MGECSSSIPTDAPTQPAPGPPGGSRSSEPKVVTTVFVSSLPSSLDSAGLLERASSIGPVKAAFVVADPQTHASRGFGYIKFVLREDAETALKDGLGHFEGHAKPVLLTWAKPKLNPLQNSQRGQEKASKSLKRARGAVDQDAASPTLEAKKHKKASLARLPKDPAGNRTVVLQGLPAALESGTEAYPGPPTNQQESEHDGSRAVPQSVLDGDLTATTPKTVTTKALYKRARRLGKLESVVFPVSGPASGATACAHLIFADPTAAAVARRQLHGRIFKGHLITTAIKARLDSTTRLGHAFGGRLIIRNLPFGVSEQDLRFYFAPFGPLHSIDIPTSAGTDGQKARGKGFAFVWMLSEADAQRAIEGLNGKKIRAGISLDAIKIETASLKKSKKRKLEKSAENSTDSGRVVAVDWALSKRKFEEAEEMQEGEGSSDLKQAATHGAEVDCAAEDDEDASDAEVSELDVEDDSQGSGTSGSSASSGGSCDEDDENQRRNSLGSTLFIRNIPFEATEDELHVLFRPFGPLRYARIVMDPKLKRPRGTGFVCLWNEEDALKVLEVARKLEREGAGHGPLAANGFPSLLQPDPSSSLAAQLTLHGRVLGVSKAVSREKAEDLRIKRDRNGEGKDKRHLYLMREGVIFPNSDEARALHPADLAARQQSFDQRKALLRSNPSLYISSTRLSVRQLPLYVSDNTLKRLARHALSQWPKEVKAGRRVELTREELDGQVCDPSPCAEPAKKRPQSKVKQAKILRTTTKIDPVLGLGKSRGCGFLELTCHTDALRVLRWANANPAVDKLFKEWTCEELEGLIKRHQSKVAEQDDTNDPATQPTLKKDRTQKWTQKLEQLKVELNECAKKEKKASDRPGKPSEPKPRSMLIIEFAIENAQTVKRRLERKIKSRNQETASRKKVKISTQSTTEAKVDDQPVGKGVFSVGSLIGRKRKQKKSRNR